MNFTQNDIEFVKNLDVCEYKKIQLIAKNVLDEIRNFIKPENTEKEIVAKSLQCNVLYYHKENANKQDDEKTHINIVEDVYNYIANRNEKIVKITIQNYI